MIPKIIHYCWFGHNPKSKLAEKCIKSWKKYCGDYRVMEWNEKEFDLASSPLYVQQAYDAGKWAFVTDYVRLKALTEYGGVYLDTDVELVKPLDDFLGCQAFVGFETAQNVSTGTMACEKGFPLFKEFLSHYDEITFLNPDGTLNVTTNVETVTGICKQHGLKPDGAYQVIDGLTIYPSDVFSPVDFESKRLRRTRNTVAIHWFSGSWYTEEETRHRQFLRRKARKDKVTNYLKRQIISILGEAYYERWEERLNRYQSWEEIVKIPKRITRKLIGKSNNTE